MKIDEELLDYKLKNQPIFPKDQFYLYNEICLESVLEFVDIIFDNNLDKAYFLRQYFKSFQDNFGLRDGTKAKKITK